jgi:hypothetical protein
MDIEILAVCDFAQDMAGKLVIVGVFDTIFAPKLPVVHATMAIGCRLRFQPSEAGQHSFRLSILDPERKEVIQPFTGDVNVQISPDGDSSTFNLAAIISRIQFKIHGKHIVALAIDEEEIKTIPLYIRLER